MNSIKFFPITKNYDSDDLLKLDVNLLQKIFSFLSYRHQLVNLEQCSKQWKTIVENMNFPYSKLNYSSLIRSHIKEYRADQAFSAPDCFAMLSEHEFLASQNNMLYLYDIRETTATYWHTHAKCRTMKGHADRLLSICVLPDRKAVTSSMDTTLRIWDLEKLDCIKLLHGHKDRVNKIIMLDDGSIVSCSSDKTVRLWDLENNCSEIIIEVENPVFDMVQVQKKVIAISTLKGIGILNVEKKELTSCFHYQAENITVESICITSRNTLLVSTLANNSNILSESLTNVIFEYDTTELKQLNRINPPGMKAYRFAKYMHPLPDGIIAFVSGSQQSTSGYLRNKEVNLYSLNEDKFLEKHTLGSSHTYVSSLLDQRIVTYNGTFTILPFAHQEFKNRIVEEQHIRKEEETNDRCTIS